MNRQRTSLHRFAVAVLLVALVAVACVLWAVPAGAQPDVPPPAQQIPRLMLATDRHAVFYLATLPGAPCTNGYPLQLLTAEGGTVSGACFDAEDGSARWTLLVQGSCRVVFWDRRDDDAPIEQRACVWLPTVRTPPPPPPAP